MRALDDAYARLGRNLLDDLLLVGALFRDARGDVDDRGLLVHGRIPELDLHEPGDDGGGRAAAAADHADDLGVGVLVDLENPLPPVEGHQAAGAADADVVHGVLAPDDQNLLHVIPPQTEKLDISNN